jgi:hypothetical protein
LGGSPPKFYLLLLLGFMSSIIIISLRRFLCVGRHWGRACGSWWQNTSLLWQARQQLTLCYVGCPPPFHHSQGRVGCKRDKGAEWKPIRALQQEGHRVVSEQHTVEERSRLERKVHRTLKERKAVLEMVENKAECQTEEAWTKEQADQHTLEESTCDEDLKADSA